MTTTIDQAFEDEVRAMLARRAADVPEPVAGEGPPLPTGLRIPILPEPGPRRRARALALAAAVVLVLGAVGLVVGTGDDGPTEHTGATDGPSTTSAPTGPAPAIDGLPQGLTGADLLPLWTGPGESWEDDPSHPSAAGDALGAYLRARHDGATAELSWGYSDPHVPAAAPGWVRIDVENHDGRIPGTAATAYLRREGVEWSVMAVVSEAYDLSGVVVDDGVVSGTVAGAGAGDWGIGLGDQVVDLRLPGWDEQVEPVASGPRGSSADDRRSLGAVEADGPTTLLVAPLVVADDVEPAYTELAFDPTTQAADEDAGTAAGAPLWRGPVAELGDGPYQAAAAYVTNVLGVAGATWVEEPIAATDDTNDVVVRLPAGDEVVVRLGWVDDDWLVLEVGGGGLEVSVTAVTGPEPLPGDRPGWSTRYILTFPTGEVGAYDALPPADALRAATGVVLVATDPDGQVRDIRGNPV